MKNYGDSLSNCNDDEENTKELEDSNEETPLPDIATLPQVNKYSSIG